jgi:hypothetical protein
VTGTVLVKGQVFTAEDGRKFVIVQISGERPYVLTPQDAAGLANDWAERYGAASAPAQHMTRLAAAALANDRLQ